MSAPDSERGLEVKMADHLGYDRGDPSGAGSGNSRNGVHVQDGDHYRRAGGVEVPRDRNGSFDPQQAPRRRRRRRRRRKS